MDHRMPLHAWTFPARLERGKKSPFVDGDTFYLELDLGLDAAAHNVRVGLLEVNAPKVASAEASAEKEAGLEAAAFTVLWLKSVERTGEPWPLLVQTAKKDSLGRWLAYVWDRLTEDCLNDVLVREGKAERVPLNWHSSSSKKGD